MENAGVLGAAPSSEHNTEMFGRLGVSEVKVDRLRARRMV